MGFKIIIGRYLQEEQEWRVGGLMDVLHSYLFNRLFTLRLPAELTGAFLIGSDVRVT